MFSLACIIERNILWCSCHGRCRAPACFVVFLCLFVFWGGAFFFCVFLCLFDDGVGWGGMLTFMFMLRWWCYVDHGVGWDVNIHVHVMLMMLRWSWGGVGRDIIVHVHVALMKLRWSWGGVGCTQTPLKPPGASQRCSLVMFVFDMGMYNWAQHIVM